MKASPVASKNEHHPLLLLHGMFGEAGNWQECQRRWSPVRKVLAPPLPLFSLKGDEPPINALATFALGVLDSQGIDKAVVAGNSLGGHVALRLALAHPDRVAALVLTGSSGLFERGFERKVPRRPSRSFLHEKISEVFYDSSLVTEELMDGVNATLTDVRKAVHLLRLAKAAKRDNLNLLLHRITCPTLLVWGENDNITPPSVGHEFHELITGSQIRFIPRCGHAPMMERPEEFNAILDEFFTEPFVAGTPALSSLALL